ncbi:MAG: succinate dehydrogenase assembly factor 2 [Inquilinus sp.]|nr:succinate dehydrogenase assembly factor 2 [Inquilinus sp.]
MSVRPERLDLAARRRRLRFRCWHRGTREADLLLGSFADRHVERMDEAQLDRLERLLGSSDPDLYNWMTDREPVPPHLDTDVMRLLKKHRYAAGTP